ncbi:MAG: SIMPL domain-containing protein, partial [Alphaproteobacteria bacterium]|nr:SIMPL domain-containing protein [Alphaproteobacteria bacterium]
MNLDDQPFDNPPSRLGLVAAAFLLTLGIGTGSFFLAQALETGLSRMHNPHIVSVKGLAEREVKADLALWPLRYVEASEELQTAQMRIENSQKAVVDFLKSQGMADDEFSVQRTDVVDLLAREYHNENPNKIRFIVYGNVMIRTNNVD